MNRENYFQSQNVTAIMEELEMERREKVEAAAREALLAEAAEAEARRVKAGEVMRAAAAKKAAEEAAMALLKAQQQGDCPASPSPRSTGIPSSRRSAT